jgi:hypothetical protein
MYSHISILTFGKHKLKKLRDIPASYLLKLHNDLGVMKNNNELKEYIESNLDILKDEEQGLKSRQVVKPETPRCEKVTFATEKIAKSRLREINSSIGNNKKPVRAYECELCGGWHHTSIPFEEYKKII